MKRLGPPGVDWLPHSIRFHGDHRSDPFYWLRGQRKASADSSSDLTLLHYTDEEYKERGIDRSEKSCPCSPQDIKALLRSENAYTETFIPWKLKLSDEFTEEVVKSVLGLPEGSESPKVTVRSALSSGGLPVSPLLSLGASFAPSSQMIYGATEKRKKMGRSKDNAVTKDLETPAHFLFRELKRRVNENDSSIPHRDNRYWYFSRTVPKKEYPIHCRVPYNESTKGFLDDFVRAHEANPKFGIVPCLWDLEEVILDLNLLQKEHTLDFLETGDMDESPQGSKLCVAVDMSGGKEIFTLLVFDVASLGQLPTEKRKNLPFKQLTSNPPVIRTIDLFECSGECVFLSEHVIAYTALDNQQRPYRLILHDLRLKDDDDMNDVVLFEETDPRFSVGGLGTSDADCSARYFFFSSSSKDASELHRGRLPEDHELSSLAISDFLSFSHCLVPRPQNNECCEITEVWHENLDGSGSSGWLFVHNREPYHDFTVSFVLERDIAEGAEVVTTMRRILEYVPSMVVESLEAQEGFLLVSVRESGLQNCYVFPITYIQSVASQILSGANIQARFVDGVNLSSWFTQRAKITGQSMYSIEGSVSNADTFRSDIIRVSASHFVRMSEVWEISVSFLFGENSPFTFQRLYTEHLPVSGFDPDAYAAQQVRAPVHAHIEGTPGASGESCVPIMLCYRKDTFVKGESPLVLDVYGSYGDCFDAEFSRNRLSLLDRGVVCAIAWVRGGGEMGRGWRDAGRLQFRSNSISDLCTCAEYLKEERWCGPSNLVIRGGSAGGTIVCGAMLKRPELFRAVMASVPFVDCLTTMLDPSIPLTTLEWEEWGNPVKDSDAYETIKLYSPMDGVPGFELLSHSGRSRPTNLNATFARPVQDLPQWPLVREKILHMPHLYVDSGLGDSRVPYWEPMAFVTRLRAVTKAFARIEGSYQAPLLLHRCQLEAGHGGASGRFAYLKEIAREYVFLFKVLGIKVCSTEYGEKEAVSDSSSGCESDT